MYELERLKMHKDSFKGQGYYCLISGILLHDEKLELLNYEYEKKYIKKCLKSYKESRLFLN